MCKEFQLDFPDEHKDAGLDSIRNLVQVCSNTLSGHDLSSYNKITPEFIAPIVEALDRVHHQDAGLVEPWHWVTGKQVSTKAMPTISASEKRRWNVLQDRPPALYYYDIVEDPLFSIGVFVIPPGSSIPLHDHPQMAVISKVLYGSMRVTSYDWTTKQGEAKMYDTNTLQATGDIKSLFPNQMGNIHQFSNDQNDVQAMLATNNQHQLGCAIIDVILPPYHDHARPCTYYKPVKELGDGNYLLKTVRQPDDFVVQNIL